MCCRCVPVAWVGGRNALGRGAGQVLELGVVFMDEADLYIAWMPGALPIVIHERNGGMRCRLDALHEVHVLSLLACDELSSSTLRGLRLAAGAVRNPAQPCNVCQRGAREVPDAGWEPGKQEGPLRSGDAQRDITHSLQLHYCNISL